MFKQQIINSSKVYLLYYVYNDITCRLDHNTVFVISYLFSTGLLLERVGFKMDASSIRHVTCIQSEDVMIINVYADVMTLLVHNITMV